MEIVTDFISFGTKITANSDCCHEIKRQSLPGRKAMTNLDSILTSRDITLLTEVCIVKTMVFPVVMYGCEIWPIKKAECQKNECFQVVVLLFTIARTWKQPRRPSADEWIKKLWYIYTMEYYSAIKRNTFESVLMR